MEEWTQMLVAQFEEHIVVKQFNKLLWIILQVNAI